MSVLSDEELRGNLITPDACGQRFKAAALDELMRRTVPSPTLTEAQVEEAAFQWTGRRVEYAKLPPLFVARIRQIITPVLAHRGTVR